MALLELQTVYASLETNSKSRLAAADASMGSGEMPWRRYLAALSISRSGPKFQVSNNAMLIAQSLSRPPDLKTVHGSIQNALSLVIDRIAPNAPAIPKKVRVVAASGPIMHSFHR